MRGRESGDNPETQGSEVTEQTTKRMSVVIISEAKDEQYLYTNDDQLDEESGELSLGPAFEQMKIYKPNALQPVSHVRIKSGKRRSSKQLPTIDDIMDQVKKEANFVNVKGGS